MLCSEEPDNTTYSCLCSRGAVLLGARQHMRQAGKLILQRKECRIYVHESRAGGFAGLPSWCEEASNTMLKVN